MITTPARTAQQTILVVEDESILRQLLSTTLRSSGYKVIEAVDGDSGRQMALTYHPELVLLDIIMPVMNGLDMLKFLRQDGWGKTANVMLLTNLDDVQDIKRAKSYGITDYLVKSDWSLDELITRVHASLD